MKASNEYCNVMAQCSVLDTYTRAFSGQFLLIFEVVVVPLDCGHHWDHLKCPNQRDVHNNIISEVVLYIHFSAYNVAATTTIQIRELSLLQSGSTCNLIEVPLYMCVHGAWGEP